jgi:hypothetical protein
MTSLFSRLNSAHVVSLSLVAAAFVLLSPTSGSLSGISSVFGYGAGISVDTTSVLNGYAVADDSYPNGFKFKMRVTIDNPAESSLFLRFNDWAKVGGGGTIPTASNMLVNLANSTSGAASAATSYGSALTAGTDLDPSAPGLQQDVYIWLKVPASTVGGAYSTSYGVKSSN